jgi:threonine-phosphate decarboxylase
MLYGHGDNGYQYGQEPVADFSTNVWWGGEPAGLKEHLFRQWKRINKYPEVLAESLAKKAGTHHALNPENILITSGSTESIYLLAQAYKHKRSAIAIPSFAEYEDACRMHEHRICFLPWNELLEMASPADAPLQTTDLVWICNPNNPTGQILPGIETVIRNHPETLFAVDEAFIEFTVSLQSLIPLIPRLQNLIVLRSLTKTFAIPGLRLGYVVAHRDLIEKLQALKLPWSVNAMALEAGNFIFDHYAGIQPPLMQLLQDKAAFVRELQETQARVFPSHTHFFVCETTHATAAELQAYLLDTFQILIRDASNFRGLGKKHFRLATLAPGHNQLLVNALKEWQKHYT